MKAVILAAGRGVRMGTDGPALPKCLHEVGERTLLARMLAELHAVGTDEVVVVVGYEADSIRAAVDAVPIGERPPVRYLLNEEFERGSILSLRRAVECFDQDDLLIMDADVLFHPQVLERLVRSAHSSAFLLDRRSEATGEEMMLVARDGRVRRIARQVEVEADDVVGEGVGFLRVARADQAALARALEVFVAQGEVDRDYEDAIDRFLAEAEVGFEEVRDLPWIEIDFADDLRRARETVLAEIQAR